MSQNLNDLIESLMDEQARVNASAEAGSINDPINDILVTNQTSTERLGLSETTATSTTAPPHLWNDTQTAWGFFTWPNAATLSLSDLMGMTETLNMLASASTVHRWNDGQTQWGFFTWA